MTTCNGNNRKNAKSVFQVTSLLLQFQLATGFWGAITGSTQYSGAPGCQCWGAIPMVWSVCILPVVPSTGCHITGLSGPFLEVFLVFPRWQSSLLCGPGVCHRIGIVGW